MNFLAHSLFGFEQAELTVGQFCGDFVRGSDLTRFPEAIETGIRLHRHLDAFTDAHPPLLQARSNLMRVPRRLSGIVIDVLFDHYLANHWQSIHRLTLKQHADFVHQVLIDTDAELPDALRRFTRVLVKQELLVNYRHLSTIESTLARLATRSPAFSALAIDKQQLALIADSLDTHFQDFYPIVHQQALSFLNHQSRTEIGHDRAIE